MTPEVRFYHLTRSALEQALPKLLELTLQRDKRAVVVAQEKARVEALTNHLWTYDDRGYLPHGSAVDGHGENQPVWLTTQTERPNGAGYLFFVDGRVPAAEERAESDEMWAVLFSGHDEVATENAREAWRLLKQAGLPLTYWTQQERGWQKSAEANQPPA